MLEKSRLRYLYISDLHKWHLQALSSVAESLLMNKHIKIIGLHNSTKDCLNAMQDLVPSVKFEVESFIKSRRQNENDIEE